jgi:hypothetical protein
LAWKYLKTTAYRLGLHQCLDPVQQILPALPQLVDFLIVRLGPELLEPTDFLLNLCLFTLETKTPQSPDAVARRGWRTGRRRDR